MAISFVPARVPAPDSRGAIDPLALERNVSYT